MRVLNFGSLNIDYVYQVDHFVQPGETLSSEKLQVNCGGKGLNQSIALARAGVETWHAGCIGKEGLFLREKLENSGVHTQFVEQVSGSNGHAIIQVDPSGQNSILLHAGSNSQLDEAFVDRVLDHFSSEDVVLLQNETSCVGYILEQAARRGMRVALNAAPANSALLSMPLERLTWLLVNEVEGAVLAGQESPEAIVSCLTRRYPRAMLVLTLGTEGSIAALGDTRARAGIFPVQAVDTTAAGDTFTGYFLRGMLDGAAPEACLRLASAASALAVTRPGAADSVPAYGDVLDFLKQN